ncbi:hypothetical protein E2C01_090669 [Portunus trituberculatus]|uniref:Uncharacterized protein n=1 Tax=Portunus trituberculatus TaxID=210409 RepID=A0A5B7JQQ7_PORTR|nr:hypothetical protein [Portunus trituberculatus]
MLSEAQASVVCCFTLSHHLYILHTPGRLFLPLHCLPFTPLVPLTSPRPSHPYPSIPCVMLRGGWG